MKKILFVLILFAAGFSGFSQNVISGKIATSLKITADTGINVQAGTAFNNNYTWQLWASWTGSTLAGTPYLKVQVSVDGIAWLDYPKMDSVAITAVTQSKAFEDFILPSNYMRLYINMTAGDTLKSFNCWRTIKRP